MKKLVLPFLVFAFFLAFHPMSNAQVNDYDAGPDAQSVMQASPGVMPEFLFDYYTWYPISAFPATPGAWFYHPVAVLGDTLFSQANPAGAAGTSIYKYVIGAGNGGGSWVAGPTLPASLVGGDMIACNNKLYYIGGGNSTISTGGNGVYEWDPATNVWSTKAIMPASLTGHGAVNWGDSIIFVIGGPWTTSGSDRNVYYYRIATNTWGTITNSLPAGTGRRSFGLGISGNKIIIAAGYSGAFRKDCYVGIIAAANQITWAPVADVPTTYGGLSRMGGEATGHYFFTVGGERMGGGYHNETYIFNLNTSAWLPIISMKPTGVSNIFNSVAGKLFGDTIRIFAPAGYNGAGITSFEVLKFYTTSTGIEEAGEDVISVYPNPTQGILNVYMKKDIRDARIDIFNSCGQMVYSRHLENNTNTLDLSALPKGLYIAKLVGDRIMKTQKLTIL